jgi:hemoglobin
MGARDTLFEELGGMPCLDRVHRVFYEKLLAHPWLRQFFQGVRREHLESQQSEFMSKLFGGPDIYRGRNPKGAHMHMYITEEVFQARHDILERSLNEAGIAPDLRRRWLDYDMGLKKALVKTAVSECAGRFGTDPIIAPSKPHYIS